VYWPIIIIVILLLVIAVFAYLYFRDSPFCCERKVEIAEQEIKISENKPLFEMVEPHPSIN
jgi:hypothetical protein